MIYKDFKTTGKCRLFVAKDKEAFSPNLCSLATVKSDPMAKILSDECDHKYIKIIIIIFTLFKLRSVITSLFTPYYFRRLKLKRNY